ncbi:reverse transcriptase domain-containing protein [Tanacetum coccineum]
MTRSNVKRLTEPIDEPEREFRRLKRVALRSHQNESLAIAGRNLFDNEASPSNNTGPKSSAPPKTLHEHSHPTSSGFQNPITIPTEQTGRIVDSHDIWFIQNTCTFQGLKNEDPLHHVKHYLSIIDNIQADGATRDTSRGSHEADECKQLGQAEQVCLSGGDIYDDPSLLRSKFEDELANFMLEKKSHAKGIGDMLVQYHKELREQYSQILSAINKSETPKPEAPTFAITTRSGISTQDPPFLAPPRPATDNFTKGETKKEGPEGAEPSITQEPAPRPSILYQPSKTSNLPFPSRLKRQKKDDEDERLLSIFKQIHIILPFLEAMIHMPKGAKVLKDLLSHKENLEKAASLVKLSEECSAIIQRSLPQKEGDPGSFTLPCLIGPLAVKNALADLGASINLMLHSLFRRLGISELKPTKMSIQLADRKWTEDEEEEDSNKALAISFYPRTEPVEPLEWKAPENRLRPSSVEPPKLELKELPKNLKYAFLQESNQLPVDQEKTTFACPYGTLHTNECPSDYAMPPTTFQRCMTVIFHELIEDSMEVFMDDFSVFGSSFDHCLKNLEKMLKRCEETNLVLNWEKCHFMVKEGIVLSQKVSGSGIKVDKAKIEAISKLPYPMNVKAIRIFLGHAGKLTRAEIRDLFPEERLMAISDKDNKPCVLTESFKDAWPEMKQHKFFNSVTADHPEDTMASPPQQGKFSRSDSTGHISFVMHINELDEMRLNAYESSISYKERTKRWHDKRIKLPINYKNKDKVIFNEKKLGSS